MIFGYVDMTVYFNGKKYQQLGFMHLKVDVIIFSKNESIFDFSRLRTTIYIYIYPLFTLLLISRLYYLKTHYVS